MGCATGDVSMEMGAEATTTAKKKKHSVACLVLVRVDSTQHPFLQRTRPGRLLFREGCDAESNLSNQTSREEKLFSVRFWRIKEDTEDMYLCQFTIYHVSCIHSQKNLFNIKSFGIECRISNVYNTVFFAQFSSIFLTIVGNKNPSIKPLANAVVAFIKAGEH